MYNAVAVKFLVQSLPLSGRILWNYMTALFSKNSTIRSKFYNYCLNNGLKCINEQQQQ